MKKKSNLFIFILLNIIISATTTFGIIFLWEKANPRPQISTNQASEAQHGQDSMGSGLSGQNQSQGSPEIDLTLVNDDLSVIIYAIVGAGNLDSEYVEIRNLSNGAVDPAGWQLADENGNTFTFPSSPSWVLNSGGAVKVLSKSGNNSVIELFWQSDAPIWQSGELATLLDANGNIIATYSIP